MKRKIRLRKGRALGYSISQSKILSNLDDNSFKSYTTQKPQTKGGEKTMNKILGYGGILIALLSQLIGVLGIIPATIADLIGGIFGFGGLIAVRTWIDSSGIKTKIIAVLGIVASVLVGVNVLPIPVYAKVIGFIVTLAGASIAQAISKAAPARAVN